ncbi:SDR family NAD(P)-dependent oxidoreductase [Spirosoma sp. HMF4905]|uniref:SDR family NAD(P)-dependent oxidoreductase n=1 Tax=Spirosoma arboris TaxID=2682092 RepID=A0A7K1SBY7_9BACT|nr:SDR family NAD(P)-dependent oxidoreductase [Spirosoma arboris]MVM31333.1 SDR family NAD(P)-dependent oxidoreductase [Spirosoma arboris]
MKTTQNTVLITGGSAGIGFEIAKLFDQKGNHVIITGRNEDRLQKAAAQLKNVTAIACDVTQEDDVNRLVDQLYAEFPDLNILINNAGNAFYYKLVAQENAFENAREEMLTNYLSIIRLTEKLAPLLSKQEESAIVNVSSIVAFAPSHRLPTYAASKAALHSYTQSLRITLERSTTTKVFELMPPLVNTDFSQAIGGENGIAPSVVADDLLTALENDEYEIHVGNTAQIYALSLSSPSGALAAMNA